LQLNVNKGHLDLSKCTKTKKPTLSN